MKKTIILLCMLVGLCGAAKKNKSVNVTVCRGEACFTTDLEDAVSYKNIEAKDGTQYVRFFLRNNQVMDLNVTGKQVSIHK